MADQGTGSAVNKPVGNAREENKKDENETTGKQIRTKRTHPAKSRNGHHAKLRHQQRPQPQESAASAAGAPPTPNTVPIYRAALMPPHRSQQNANPNLPPGPVTFGPPPQFYPGGNSFANNNQPLYQMQFPGPQPQDGNGFPVMPPPPSPRLNYGPQVFGMNGFNPLLLAGMKNIRDGDIDNMLFEHWNSQMILAAWSPNRQMTSNPENDVFVRSFVEPPWSDTGNVIFFCEGGKVVRCHAVLLQGILPKFTNELMEMTKFQYSAYVKELPYIPVFVGGIDQRCIEHLVNLIYRGLDMLTGKEAFKLIQVVNVLNIYELSICIAPAPAENLDGGWNENYDDRASATPGNQRAPPSGRLPHLASFDFGLANNATENSVEYPGGSKSASQEEVECESQGRVAFNQDEPQDPLATAFARIQAKGKKDTNDTIHISQGSRHSGHQSKDTDFADGEETTPATSQQTSFVSPSQRSTDPIDEQRGMLLTAHPSENVANMGSSTSFPLLIDKLPGTAVPVVNSNAGEQTNTDNSKPLSGRRRSFRRKTESTTTSTTKRLRQFSENNGSPSDGDDEDVDEDESDMKKRKRTVYPKGMKGRALTLLNEGSTVKEVANTLQVPGRLISRWKYEAKKSDDPNISFTSGIDEVRPRNIIVGKFNSEESGRMREDFGQNVHGGHSIISGFGDFIKEEDPMNLI